jgi:hypothetical protein
MSLLELRSYIQRILNSEALCNISQRADFVTLMSCYHTPNSQASGPLLFSCPRLLIQYIRSYPAYLEISSVRNLRTRHAVVTGNPPNADGVDVMGSHKTQCHMTGNSILKLFSFNKNQTDEVVNCAAFKSCFLRRSVCVGSRHSVLTC